MTGENLIRIDNGGDQTRFPWLGTYRLSRLENQLLLDGLRHFQVFTDGQFPKDVARQSLLAQIAADKSIAQAAPGLHRLIGQVRADRAGARGGLARLVKGAIVRGAAERPGGRLRAVRPGLCETADRRAGRGSERADAPSNARAVVCA